MAGRIFFRPPLPRIVAQDRACVVTPMVGVKDAGHFFEYVGRQWIYLYSADGFYDPLLSVE